MKSITALLLILLLAAVSSLEAQTTGTTKDSSRVKKPGAISTYYAEFDAARTGSKAWVSIPSSLPENSLLITRIRNVNPLATRITIKTSSFNLDFSDGKDVFSQLMAGPKKDTAKKQDAPAKAAIDTNNAQFLKMKIISLQQEKANSVDTLVLECLRQFWEKRNRLLLFQGLDTSLYLLSQQPVISLDQLKKQVNNRLSCFGLTDSSTACDIQEIREALLRDLYLTYDCIFQHYQPPATPEKNSGSAIKNNA